MALPTKLTIICLNLAGSEIKISGIVSSNSIRSSIFFSRAFDLKSFSISKINSFKLKGIFSRVSSPASILEKSSISFRRTNKLFALFCMFLVISCCSSASSVSINISVIPITPFIGVRSS